MKNISFFLEDAGFFMSKIKFLPETRIYISDFKINEIREIDKEFFFKEIYKYPKIICNAPIQLIFVEKCKFCNGKKLSKEFLIWKLSTSLFFYLKDRKNRLKNWLLFAIGLYDINFVRLDKVLKILKNEKNVEVSNVNILGDIDPEKEWFERIELFSKVAQEIEEYWNWYDSSKEKIKKLNELKEIIILKRKILKLEECKVYFEESQKKVRCFEEENILLGYFFRTIDSYIKFNQANLINKINSLLDGNENEVKISKESMYLECFDKREIPSIRNILKYKKAPEYKDFYKLKEIIEYLKKKRNLKEPENYSIDFAYITCLKFEIFKILKDFPLSETYLKFNYSINDNWFNEIFEEHQIKGKIYYVLRKKDNIEYNCQSKNDKFLYEKKGEETVEPYNQEQEEYIIGKVYSEEEIEDFFSIFKLVNKTLS